jgi:hypothetical protein
VTAYDVKAFSTIKAKVCPAYTFETYPRRIKPFPMVMSDKCEPVSARTVKGAVRLMIASIKLMGQSKSIRSIIDTTSREQRHGLA